MKKKISSKLTLGKRSIASLSNQDMSIIDGGTVGGNPGGDTGWGAYQSAQTHCGSANCVGPATIGALCSGTCGARATFSNPCCG